MPEATQIRGIGHSVRRKEDPRFIRGQGNYIDDVKLPGMLYMDIVRSPYAHARITNIDASGALKVPGVVAVITGKDLEAAGLAWMPTLMSDTQMVLPSSPARFWPFRPTGARSRPSRAWSRLASCTRSRKASGRSMGSSAASARRAC